jgi:hypothetical protein
VSRRRIESSLTNPVSRRIVFLLRSDFLSFATAGHLRRTP